MKKTTHYRKLDELLYKHPLSLIKLIYDEVNYIYIGKWNDDNVIVKFMKDMPEIDYMKNREINILQEFKKIKLDINIPTIFYYDPSPIIIDDTKFKGGWYIQQYIPGFTLFHIDNKNNQYVKRAFLLTIKALEKIHTAGFIHGDTHGGNFIYSPVDDKIYVIDFEFTYSYIGDTRFKPTNNEDDFLDFECDTSKIIRTFISYVSGKPFWVSEFGNIDNNPMKILSHDAIIMANKLTGNTKLSEFKFLLENVRF